MKKTTVRQRSRSRRRLSIALGWMVALAISMVVYLYLPRALPAKPLSFQLISHRGVHQTFPLENLQNDTKVYVADVDTPEDLEKVRGLPIDGIVTNRIEAIGPILKR